MKMKQMIDLLFRYDQLCQAEDVKLYRFRLLCSINNKAHSIFDLESAKQFPLLQHFCMYQGHLQSAVSTTSIEIPACYSLQDGSTLQLMLSQTMLISIAPTTQY